MPKWLQRLLTILLTWWLLALFVQPFSVINPIAHPRELAGYVVIISLISYLAALWPRAWPIWLTTAFLSMIVGLWAILPLKQHFGLTWLTLMSKPSIPRLGGFCKLVALMSLRPSA